MGAWGTAVFADDAACDVRDAFRHFLGEGLSPGAATKKVRLDLREAFKDYDDGPVCWLALAKAKADAGCLDEATKMRALLLIDSGKALAAWAERADERLTRQRAKVLANLRKQLAGKQRKFSRPQAPQKEYVDKFEWPVGGIVAYRMSSGRQVLLVVIKRKGSKRKGFRPVFGLLDWIGDKIPPVSRVCKLPFRMHYLLPGATKKWPRLWQIENEPPRERITWLEGTYDLADDKKLGEFFRWYQADRHIAGYSVALWEFKPRLKALHIDGQLKQAFRAKD